MEWLDVILRREVVIGLAVGGALAATVGSYARQRKVASSPLMAVWLLYGGYALTGVSLLIFIVMGFRAA